MAAGHHCVARDLREPSLCVMGRCVLPSVSSYRANLNYAPHLFLRLRAYFVDHLKHIVAAEHERKIARYETSASHTSQGNPSRAIVDNLVAHGLNELHERQPSKIAPIQRRSSKWTSADGPPAIRTDMVRRLDVAPCPIDPTGNTTVGSYASGVYLPSSGSPRVADSECSPRDRSIDSRVCTYASAQAPPPQHAHPESFGGFPYPWRLLSRALRRLFPTLHQKLRRTMTMPRTSTLLPPNGDTAAVVSGEEARRVPYISFSAIVGRNSTFRDLTDENIEELGGVEYRALTALLWIVPLVGLCALESQCMADRGLPIVLLWIARDHLRHYRPLRQSCAMAMDIPHPGAASRHQSNMVCFLCTPAMEFCSPQTGKVLGFSGCRCLGQHGHVSGRPEHGALSRGISYDHLSSVRRTGWEYGLCESHLLFVTHGSPNDV